MTSYMVYKPPSALSPGARKRMAMSHDAPAIKSSLRPQQRGATSQDGKAMSDGMPEGPHPTPRPATTVNLGPEAPAHSARPFDHDIPDHILQAWPLIHKVHSRNRNTVSRSGDTADGLPPTALTRRRTRNSQGVYRSSVLTPGEVEFMARKREARRRAALQQRQGAVTRSCTEFFSASRAFVTQDVEDGSYSGDTCRDQYSRMTVDSRASIVPSTIEVTLPARQDALRSRMRSRQDPQLRLAGSAVGGEGAGTDASATSPRTSALLGREKATGNNIRRSGAKERRQREERRQEQQFILQPTSGADWYESQGLSTPTVLHKYLNDSFYTSSVGNNAKPEVDTTALLNYIRHKQKNTTYVPPPPSSGSEAEEDDDAADEDYQEVRMDASGRVLQAGVGAAAGPAMRPSVSFEDLHHSKHDRTSHGQPNQSSQGPSRRTIKENGCFDLLVGGDRLGAAPSTWAGHVTKTTGDWPVTGVSNLQIGHQQKGTAAGNKQSVKPNLATNMESTVPDIEVSPDDGANVGNGEVGEGEGDAAEEPSQEQRYQGDNTKKITVVLPSSDDASVKTTD